MVALFATMGLVFLMRLSLMWDFEGFGADMASYLTTRNYVLGHDPTWPKEAHARPPMVGLLLLPFTFAFGDLWGSKLVALITCVALAVPMYALSRYWLRPWWAFVASILLILQPFVAMYTMGGYLPLIGLGMAMFAMRALLDVMDGRAPVWVPMLAVFAMSGLNQSIVPLCGAVMLWFVLYRRNMQGFKAMLLSGVGVAAWAYWYIGPVLSTARMDLAGLNWGIANLVLDPFVYMIIAIPAFAFAFMLWRDKPVVWLLGVPCVLFALLANVRGPDVATNNVIWRSHYMVPVFLTIGFGVGLTSVVDAARARRRQSRGHSYPVKVVSDRVDRAEHTL